MSKTALRVVCGAFCLGAVVVAARPMSEGNLQKLENVLNLAKHVQSKEERNNRGKQGDSRRQVFKSAARVISDIVKKAGGFLTKKKRGRRARQQDSSDVVRATEENRLGVWQAIEDVSRAYSPEEAFARGSLITIDFLLEFFEVDEESYLEDDFRQERGRQLLLEDRKRQLGGGADAGVLNETLMKNETRLMREGRRNLYRENTIRQNWNSRFKLWKTDSDGNTRLKYCFQTGLTDYKKTAFRDAMEHINREAPCLQFIEIGVNGRNGDSEHCDDSQNDSVYVQEKDSGCYAWLGHSGNNMLNLINVGNPPCGTMGVMAHEMGHELGMFHEHSRMDRDEHIRVSERWLSNSNFKKDRDADTSIPYDVGSLLHYGSLNGGITALRKEDQGKLGQRQGLSKLDKQQLNNMYCGGSGGSPTTTTTTSTRPTTPSGSCVDKRTSCAAWKSYGYCSPSSRYHKVMTQDLCRKTCRTCSTGSPTTPRPTTTTTTTTRAATAACYDVEKYRTSCPVYKARGYCSSTSRYYDQMTQYCKKTCGGCGTSNRCRDSEKYKTSCPSWKRQGYCNRPIVKTNYCRKTCETCI